MTKQIHKKVHKIQIITDLAYLGIWERNYIFTVQRYAYTVLAIGLCPSVTSRCSTKMAKPRIT